MISKILITNFQLMNDVRKSLESSQSWFIKVASFKICNPDSVRVKMERSLQIHKKFLFVIKMRNRNLVSFDCKAPNSLSKFFRWTVSSSSVEWDVNLNLNFKLNYIFISKKITYLTNSSPWLVIWKVLKFVIPMKVGAMSILVLLSLTSSWFPVP